MQQILASRLFSTRRGTAVMGVLAALLAGIVLIAYLNSYRDSVRATSDPVTVLVARNLIEAGTPGTLIASKKLFQATEVAQEEVKAGALADPAAIRDRVALADIYPGQQLTVADFTIETTTAIPTKLTGDERAISINLDPSHGITGPLRTGDHVDVWKGAETAADFELLIPNAEVLSAPNAPAEGGDANVILRINWWEAPRVAAAQNSGSIWLVLRPQTDAKPTKPVSPLYVQAPKGG